VRWTTLWPLIKDVVFTGTGVFAITWEVLSAHPNGLVLGTGLALTVPSVAEHVKALLPSSGGGGSLPSSQPPTEPPSPSSPPGASSGS
jgi:hypothetical protein